MDGTAVEAKEVTDVVTIPMQRYVELLDLETRVDVVVERFAHSDYVRTEDILWILGTELAIELAIELRRKDEESRKKYNEDANYDK